MSKAKEHRTDEWASRSHPVEEDMKGQMRFWKGQRIGWILLCAGLAAAFLGLFSEGPLSWKTAVAAGGELEVEHQRFYRNGASSFLTLRVEGAGTGTEREIVIDSNLARKLTLETINPEPIRSQARPDGLHLFFSWPGGGTIHIALRPNGIGKADGFISLAGTDARARVNLFIFP